MLKAYRNELQWPPKHILKYPGARSPTASQMERMGSDRSIRSVKQIDDAQELEYCRSVQQYLRDHGKRACSSKHVTFNLTCLGSLRRPLSELP